MAQQDNSLNFTTRVDLSGLNDGMAQVNQTIADSSAATASAITDTNDVITGSFAEMQAAGVDSATAIAEAQSQAQEAIAENARQSAAIVREAAESNAAAATEEAAAVVDAVDIEAAAYLQLAEARQADKTAQMLLASAYKTLGPFMANNAAMTATVAGMEREAAASSEQLRLAKANLAEVTEFVAVAQAQEAATATEAATVTKEYAGDLTLAGYATKELADAEVAEEVVQKSSISTRMAASAELRVLEGNMMGSTRAAGALLTMIPGLGAAMQSAFAVFGAVALLEILGEIIKKVHGLYDEYVNLRSLQNVTLKELSEADKEDVKLAEEKLRLRREQRVLDAEMASGNKGRGDAGAAAGAAFDIEQDKVRARTDLENIQALTNERKRLQDQSRETVTRTGLIGPYETQTLAARQATEQIKQVDQQLRTFVTDYDVAADKIAADREKEALRIREAGEKRQGNPEQLLLQQIEFEFQQKNEEAAKITGAKMTPGEAAAFWKAYLDTFKDGTTQAKTVLENYARAVEENHKKIIDQFKKVTTEQERAEQEGSNAIERGMAANTKWANETIDDILRVGPRWNDYSKAIADNTEIVSANARSAEAAKLKIEESEGVITKLAADQRIAAIDTENLTEKIKALREELAKLQEEQKGLTPGGSGYEKNITQQQQLMNQILKAQGQQTVAAITDNGKITQDIAAPFQRAFNTINQDMTKTIASIRNGTESATRAFSKMGIDILESMEDSFIKMVLVATENELKMTLVHALANQQRVASDTAAAAESTAVSKTSALEEIFVDAKAAAAGAWKATVGIPIVGPALAPAAAAATFAAVLALGAFEQGGIIPGSGAVPIVGHGGERVLTSSQTNTFETFVHNMTAAPSSQQANQTHIHYSPEIHSYDGSGMRSALRAHSEDILDVVREGLQTGALGRGNI